jgi:uncharacterized protein involved in outer membrane biogenesis
MKKKIIIGIGIGFVVVVVATLVVVGFFLGDVVKAGMNTIGPKVTQTTFTVDSVHIMPLSGSVSLNNFVIGSPEGFKATNAISVGKTAVRVAPLSVLGGKIVVKNVEVHDPEINFEGNPFGANNLKKIMDNVNAFTGAAETKTPDTNAPARPAEKKPAKKLEVDNFLITGARVHFNGAVLPLPDIHLTNLGTGPDGITPAEVLNDVLREVTAVTIKTIGSAVGDSGKAIGNEGSKAVKSIGKSIGGLFGK